jgi:hypothetical protein
MTENTVHMCFPQFPAISERKTPLFFLTSVCGTVMYGCDKNIKCSEFLILKLQDNKILIKNSQFTGDVSTVIMNLSVTNDMPATMATYK